MGSHCKHGNAQTPNPRLYVSGWLFPSVRMVGILLPGSAFDFLKRCCTGMLVLFVRNWEGMYWDK